MEILICFGTRPEFIKVKSLLDNLSCDTINIKTVFVGQHNDLVKNYNYNYFIPIKSECNNRLSDIISSVMHHNYIFDNIDYVLVQGDTTSALGIALSAFNHQKKIIHLEAGLRTFNSLDPYPEEMNRCLISRLACIHFCPTYQNKQNLVDEKVSGDIYVTGNTGLDNLHKIKNKCSYNNKVLITLHRRDNHHIMDKWFTNLSNIAKKYTDLEFIFPIHPNPEIRKHKYLLENITVIEPIDHESLLDIIKDCKFIISDSGGLQEEASFLNKKIVICRKYTERPEILGIHGTLCDKPEQLADIVNKINEFYEIDEKCPFGNGYTWKIIKEIIINQIHSSHYKHHSQTPN